MHLDDLYAYCLARRGAWEDTPFGPDTLVFKVGKKMFGLIGLEREPLGIALKSDPERWLELREQYDGIVRGPYMDGTHWNTVLLKSDVPASEIRDLVDRSHALVIVGMTRAARAALDAEAPEASGGDASA